MALSTLPSLVDLKINLSDQNEALLILENLPYLSFLNGRSTKEENYTVDIDDKIVEKISLNDEISNFNLIFSRISEKINTVDKDKIQSYLEEFQNLLKKEITKINNAVDNSVPNYLYASNVMSSKLVIYKYFQYKFLDYLEYKDRESSQVLRDLSDNIFKSSDFIIGKILFFFIFFNKFEFKKKINYFRCCYFTASYN